MRTAFLVLLCSGCLAFSQQPTDVSGWMARGEQALKSAHYGEAADAFQHAIDIDPSNVTAHQYLGAVFFASNSQNDLAANQNNCKMSTSHR